MKRVISLSLLVFWGAQFALQMAAALKGMPLALFSPFETEVLAEITLSRSLPVSLLAVTSGLLSALFGWAAICAIAGEDGPEERLEDTVKLVFAVAILAICGLAVLSAANGAFVPFQPLVMLVGALAVSWLAAHNDIAMTATGDDAGEASLRVARAMAGEVAHKTMLGAISGRPGSTTGTN